MNNDEMVQVRYMRKTGLPDRVTHWGSTSQQSSRYPNDESGLLSVIRPFSAAEIAQGKTSPFTCACHAICLQVAQRRGNKTKLEDACTSFKQLNACVAALHISHNLKIKFNCLKWDVTGVQPASGNVASCSTPEGGKSLSLAKAIQTLKPQADAKAEAKNAERRAQEDIKDATS